MEKNPVSGVLYYKDIPSIKQDYKQGDEVWIFGLGDGKEYRATICGIAIDSIIKHYIVCPKFPDLLKMNGFTHTCVPASCLKPYWTNEQ